MPATNLNIGMDLWNASSAGAEAAKMRHNQPGAPGAGALGEQWMQQVCMGHIVVFVKNILFSYCFWRSTFSIFVLIWQLI